MFKYGKKKPQGATRNTGRTAAQGPSPLPGWLLVGLGMGIGLFIAFMLFLWKPWQPVKRASAPAATEAPDTPPTAKDTGEPRFDFYRLLPSQKVVSEEPTEQPTAPATATIKPTADKPVSSPAAPVTAKPAPRSDADRQDADRKRAEAILDGQEQTVVEKPKAAVPSKEKDKTKEKAAPEPKEKEKDTDNSKFTLQAGSFKSQAEAERRKAKVALQGLPARVQQVKVKEGEVWFRVIVGPFKGKESTGKAQGALRGDGIDSLMIKDKK